MKKTNHISNISLSIPFVHQVVLLVVGLCSISCSKCVMPAKGHLLVPTFEDVTDTKSVSNRNMTFAAAAGDFNQDSWMDLVVSNHNYIQVYINNEGKSFTPLDTLNHKKDNHGVSFIDLNNDYKPELAVSIGSRKGKGKGEGNNFFNFTPSNKFEETPLTDSILLDNWGRGRLIIPLDFNQDGIMDMSYMNYGTGSNSKNVNKIILGKTKNSSLLNQYEVIHSGIENLNTTYFTLANLFNSKDRYLILDRGGNQSGSIFKVTPDLQLIDETENFDVISASVVKRIVPLDFDNDGDLDLLYLLSKKKTTVLFENTGHSFIRTPTGIEFNAKGGDAVTGDFNNDGFIDIYIINTNLKKPIPPNALYLNNGKKEFFRINAITKRDSIKTLEQIPTIQFGASILDGLSKGESNGAVCFDNNNDGKLDIFIHNGHRKSSGSNQLLQNTTINKGNFLQINLKSTVSNTQAWGTRILVEFGDQQQYQQKFSANAKLGVSDLPFHVGLGNSKKAKVTVFWPSGKVTVLKKVKANQFITIQE